jgi:4-hydroxy-2-oxoheptanedioate aldolase
VVERGRKASRVENGWQTRQAVNDVDQILSVPGVDVVYVGPADLSVTLGFRPAADQTDAAFNDALKRICDSCKRTKVVPGIAGNAAVAPKRIEQGFLMVEVASDAGR